MDDGDTRTLLARTARTATAVGVALDIGGQSVVDDVRQVIDVETTCGHIRRHEYLGEVAAKLLHRQVALRLREVAVERLRIVAIAYQLVGYLLRLALRATEDDGVDLRIEVHDTLQGQVFVLRVDHVIDMVHILRTLIATADHDLLVVVEVALGHTLHLAAHRGREEQCVALLGNAFENLGDGVLESHVEHLVGLIKHHVAGVVETRLAPVHQVDEAARCSHDDLCAMTERTNLCLDTCATIDGDDMDMGDIAREGVEIVGDLETELAGRREHDGLRLLAVGVNTLEQGNAEGCRLARTRLGEGDDVVAVA